LEQQIKQKLALTIIVSKKIGFLGLSDPGNAFKGEKSICFFRNIFRQPNWEKIAKTETKVFCCSESEVEKEKVKKQKKLAV
jgi:hypothetical protein